MFECEKCGICFRDNYDLFRHQSRVKPCIKIKILEKNIKNPIPSLENSKSTFENSKSTFENPNNICKYCLNTFFNTNNKNKHEKVCKLKDDPIRILEIKNDIIPELPNCKTECRFCNKKLSRFVILNRHILICKEREKYHQKLLKQIITNQQNTIQTQQNNIITNNNNCNNITNQQINIQFNENTIPFGNKRLTSHLKIEKLLDILRASYKQYTPEQGYEIAGEIILKLEEYLQEIPENRNYIIDQKSPIWTIKTETGTKSIDKDKCIHSIVKENAGIICDKKEEIGIASSQVLKNQTMTEVFSHEKSFKTKGIHYKPYGDHKLSKIKSGLQIINKNNNLDF